MKKVYPRCLGCDAPPAIDPRQSPDAKSSRSIIEKGRTRPYCRACTKQHKADGRRFCFGCETLRPLDNFGPNGARADNSQGRCKTCMRDVAQVRRYGVTMEDCEALKTAQGGGCALCPRTFDEHTACVDHDHATGRVRGILCRQCNSALGKLGDTVEGLRRAIAYLERTA